MDAALLYGVYNAYSHLIEDHLGWIHSELKQQSINNDPLLFLILLRHKSEIFPDFN